MIIPRPVNMKGIYASLSGIKEIKLPAVAHMDDLLWRDAHLGAYPEVKIGSFQLSIIRDRRENSNKIRFDVL
jgi:hypothetical protein